MSTNNPEILDAARLVFGYDHDDFVALEQDELAHMNHDEADVAKILGGSVRALSTFDPSEGCQVTAHEFIGIGKNTPDSEMSDSHVVFLTWPDKEEACAIGLKNGKLLETLWDGTLRRINITDEPRWRERVLGALSFLADEKLGF